MQVPCIACALFKVVVLQLHIPNRTRAAVLACFACLLLAAVPCCLLPLLLAESVRRRLTRGGGRSAGVWTCTKHTTVQGHPWIWAPRTYFLAPRNILDTNSIYKTCFWAGGDVLDWAAAPRAQVEGAYPVHEFIYLMEGAITLTVPPASLPASQLASQPASLLASQPAS